MRIAHIYDYDPPANDAMGAQRICDFLLSGQLEIGHVTSHFHFMEDIERPSEFDIFHFHSPHNMFEADERHSQFSKKFICTIHGWSWKHIEPDVHQRISEDNRMVYLSTPHRDYHNPNGPIVYNFVDHSKYEYGEGGDWYGWIAGTDWGEEKYLFTILRLAEMFKFKLLVAGAGKNFNIIHTIIDYAKRNSNIKYLGMVNGKEKVDLLKSLCAVLMIAKFDSMSVSMPESLACGTPLVAWTQKKYPLTPFSEVLSDDVAVFCSDESELVRKILLGEAKKKDRKRCLEYSLEKFNHIRGSKDYCELYKRMLNK